MGHRSQINQLVGGKPMKFCAKVNQPSGLARSNTLALCMELCVKLDEEVLKQELMGTADLLEVTVNCHTDGASWREDYGKPVGLICRLKDTEAEKASLLAQRKTHLYIKDGRVLVYILEQKFEGQWQDLGNKIVEAMLNQLRQDCPLAPVS
jgi:hypothetical protein